MATDRIHQGAPLHVAYLSRVQLNPYVNLLAGGVQRANPAVEVVIKRTPGWRWLLQPRLDIVHLHWAELQYSYGETTPAQATDAAQSLLRKLRFARRRGVRLVYTVHNLTQHEGRFSDLNDRINRWLFAHADAIHVHDECTAASVAETYERRERVFVIPHGNYIGAYPNDVTRDEARARLSLPAEHFVYLCLGQVRPYKGLEALVSAFDAVDEPDTTLIIAGRTDAGNYEQQVRARANGNPNIHLVTSYIDDADLQLYFNAADVCVLPYRRATTSGAALLAFSFARPIVAPALGPFPALITPERGVLFQPGGDGLSDALRRARDLDAARAQQAVWAYASSLDWTTLGAQHAVMYRSIS